MIKLIDLKPALGYEQFAIYDPAIDRFVEIDGKQTWEYQEFQHASFKIQDKKERARYLRLVSQLKPSRKRVKQLDIAKNEDSNS